MKEPIVSEIRSIRKEIDDIQRCIQKLLDVKSFGGFMMIMKPPAKLSC